MKQVKKEDKQTKKKSEKKRKNILSKLILKISIIVVLVGVLFLAADYTVKKITRITTEGKYALVDKQLLYCQELVTLKYRYSDIVTLKKTSGLAKSYSIVKFSGILRAGIGDMSKVTYDISKDRKSITIKLPEAEVLGNDLVSQEVFDEKQSIFVPITTQEIFDEIEIARQSFAEDMIADGVLDEAYDYAEKVVRQMMISCGFEKINIR